MMKCRRCHSDVRYADSDGRAADLETVQGDQFRQRLVRHPGRVGHDCVVDF
jgi:hypothetical protein